MMNGKIRPVLVFFLRYGGFFSIYRHLSRDVVRILMIHGVKSPDTSDKWTPLRPQLPPARLERLIRALSRHYRFLSMDEVVETLAGRRPMMPFGIAVTFDDGYRNNLTHAWPILKRYGVPAIVYLSVGHVDRREPFWFDRLDYALQQVPAQGRRLRLGSGGIVVDASSRDGLRRSFKEFRDRIKELGSGSYAEMRRTLDALAADLEEESGKRLSDILEQDEWCGLLTWEEVLNAFRDGMSIGSHTIDHVMLSGLERREVRDQLRGSKRVIEDRLGSGCSHFCYPNGSCNDDVVSDVRDAGYTSAVTTMPGGNGYGTDLFTLKRMSFPECESVSEALLRVSGAIMALKATRLQGVSSA